MREKTLVERLDHASRTHADAEVRALAEAALTALLQIHRLSGPFPPEEYQREAPARRQSPWGKTA